MENVVGSSRYSPARRGLRGASTEDRGLVVPRGEVAGIAPRRRVVERADVRWPGGADRAAGTGKGGAER